MLPAGILLSYLASTETVHSLLPKSLVPAETAVHDQWLPAKSVRLTGIPDKSLSRKPNHADSVGRKPFFEDSSQRSGTFSIEAKYDAESLQEAKIGGLVYTL